MRQVTTKGLITVAAAGGVLALSGGYAHADSGADGTASNSPGVLSGNSVQVPVHVPVNLCGNTVNVVGVLNPAMGNACANKSAASAPGRSGTGTQAGGGSSAHGDTGNSPGVGSGNNIKVPVHVPVNDCGNNVSVVGIGNATTGNDCANEAGPATPAKPVEPGTPNTPGKPNTPGHPGTPQPPGGQDVGDPGTPVRPGTPQDRALPQAPEVQPVAASQTVAQPEGIEALAQTGGSGALGVAIPVGAGLLLTGAVLYRRARSAA